MGFWGRFFGSDNGPAYGATDIGNFDGFNKALGRHACDQVLRASAQVIARCTGAREVLSDHGFKSWLAHREGKPVTQVEVLLQQVRDGSVVLSRPFVSGDEFRLYWQDGRSAENLLSKIASTADAEKIVLRNEEGLATHVLEGIPLSVGHGATWGDAYRALVAARGGPLSASSRCSAR